LRNVKLVLEYDGTCFHGWQKQKDLKTVQGELERQLSRVLREDVRVTGAGRTDAGCHATGQVANFVTASELPLERVRDALNSLMRGELVVKEISVAADGFDARFSAVARRYKYLIAERPTALMRERAWVTGREHDLEAMAQASELLVGRRDFARFSRSDERSQRNPFCNVFEARWQKWDLGVAFEIEADRFLRGMVRMLVGTMERVGAGGLKLSDFEAALGGAPGVRVGPAAPPEGLYLVSVRY